LCNAQIPFYAVLSKLRKAIRASSLAAPVRSTFELALRYLMR
jgi:hypothetical protein